MFSQPTPVPTVPHVNYLSSGSLTIPIIQINVDGGYYYLCIALAVTQLNINQPVAAISDTTVHH